MFRTIASAAVLTMCALGSGGAAPASAAEESEPTAVRPVAANEASRWSAHVGSGFTLSPSAFLLTTGVEYEVVPQLGVGPLLQFAVDNNDTIVAPTLNARYRIDLSRSGDDVVKRIQPFVQAGLGFAYVDKDRGGRDRDDTEFMLNGGLGLEYRVNTQFSVGSAVLFNGMPAGNAVGEDFFFSWQLVTARVHF